MAPTSDREALMASQDFEESFGVTSASRIPKKQRGFLSKFANRGSLITLLKLNVVTVLVVTIFVFLFGGFFSPLISSQILKKRDHECNTPESGYRCNQPFAQLWGQYAPYTSLKFRSRFPTGIPDGCTITFAQVLSRHGARYPTSSKSKTYAKLFKRIEETSKGYEGKFKFLESFKYELGSDDMTLFGESELFNEGEEFYQRYENLARNHLPFVRASGSERVIKSAEKFNEGFQDAKLRDPEATDKDTRPVVGVIIPEGDESNNTLSHGRCPAFENDDSEKEIQDKFAKLFTPKILERVKVGLPGADIVAKDIIYLMDMCSFHTVALTPDASKLSPFCHLFTLGEWVDYDYYQSLGKWYGSGPGNPLGPDQGIGFTNELIARLTNKPVVDHTNTNHTLDDNPATFPLNATLYADFSHDNTMMSIFGALRLFDGVKNLPQDHIQSPVDAEMYTASSSVPFAGRAFIEKMKCSWSQKKDEEFVRILLNNRVMPLNGCKRDHLGRCELSDFIKGLSFATSGGTWEKCYDSKSE